MPEFDRVSKLLFQKNNGTRFYPAFPCTCRRFSFFALFFFRANRSTDRQDPPLPHNDGYYDDRLLYTGTNRNKNPEHIKLRPGLVTPVRTELRLWVLLYTQGVSRVDHRRAGTIGGIQFAV